MLLIYRIINPITDYIVHDYLCIVYTLSQYNWICMTTYSITMAIKKYEYILSVKSSSKFRRMYKSILFETFIMVEVSVYNPFVFIIPI